MGYYKKGKILIVFITFFICVIAEAQQPEKLLGNWSSTSPIEKVYLHFDRDNYIAGETAFFKAYLSSDYLPDTISTTLYVELTIDTGVIVSRAITPVLLGVANGYIDLPDSLVSGSYQIRAFSPTMLNQDPGFIFKRSIFIYGKKTKAIEVPKDKLLRLEFFPEGGNLVNGFTNTIAFKATNEYGLPALVKGKIFNEKNEQVTTFSSYHDGMGMFELTPASNQQYYAVADEDASAKKNYLPVSTDKGISLTVIPHPQGNFFELKQRKKDPAFLVAYMIGQMQHHVVFKQEFKNTQEEIQGVINTRNLHSGILQITFFNKDNQPLAERLCFVDNKEYIQRGELIADTINFNEKGRNRFSIQLKDTVRGSFSLSIVDPAYNLLPEREENIFSSLLLTADLKGYIHNPAYYFVADNDSVKTALDLLMMTNGWRRFRWTELAQKTTQSKFFNDQSFVTLSGKITLRDTKKPLQEKPILLMLITEDSTRRVQMTTTDKQGNFRLDSMLFFGKSRVLFSDIRGKKSQYIDVNMSADSLNKTFILPRVEKILFRSADHFQNSHPQLAFDYESIQKASGLMLEGVTIKAVRKSPIAELEEKYARGAFAGDGNKIIDLVNTKDADPYQNIFDFLQSRVPGLQIQNDGPDYFIYYRQAASISSMGNIPMTLYLDEIETDAAVISTIPGNQIAMVKVFSTLVASAGNAPGGVLAIYTKKGADMNDVMRYAAAIVKYKGYSVVREFYTPDYAVDKSARSKADNRITLDWRPDILVNNINPKIPVTFYNNDRTKSYKIVVEGMTVDGKMLLIEKTITRKGF